MTAVNHRRQGIGMTSQRARDRLVERLVAEGISDKRVLHAMREVPRHLFMEEAMASHAYDNTALPIGHAQTISQPVVVAKMTEAALGDAESGTKRVLEIGTGSGYQAAVLACVFDEVFSLERIDDLSRMARRRLRKLGYSNVRARHDDGCAGWPEKAPFDAIVITAGGAAVDERLLEQLGDGGRLIAPVGGADEQRLLLFTRHGDDYEQQDLGAAVFVPLLGGLA